MKICTGKCIGCSSDYEYKNINKIRCDSCQNIHHKKNMSINHKKRYVDEKYREKVQEYNNKWRDDNRKKVYNKDKERRKSPGTIIKLRARELARSILMDRECDICESKENLQKHHWRYDKPMLVNTLCSYCHTIQHIKNKHIEDKK